MQVNAKSKSIYYPDVLIFLWIIPFISAFNFHLTYPKFNSTPIT